MLPPPIQPNSKVVVKDGATGRSRGFGFVTYPDECTANAAIAMNEPRIRINLSVNLDQSSATLSPPIRLLTPSLRAHPTH